MSLNQHFSSVKALGKIEGIKDNIRRLDQVLGSANLWRPGQALRKECGEVLRMIEDLEERFEQKLVVTIIGPSGSGKSTLLNALAGVDNLSDSGHRRPTTRSVVVFCRSGENASQIRRKLGAENVTVQSSQAASTLEHVMLIDTPDTDSTQQEKHIPIVKNAISLSDVLICLFDAENPKRRDYVDFLYPYVQMFQGEALLVVLNKCDRLDEQELTEQIIPDMDHYLRSAWDRPVNRLLCISARNHLQEPGWDENAKPRHLFDQYDELEKVIFGTYNSAAFVIDRRIENAESLKKYLAVEVRSEVKKDERALKEARDKIVEAERQAIGEAVSSLTAEDSKQVLGVNVLLYQKLAQRWMGPVGWLIAIWGRILIFGTGMAAIFRFGNPIRQIIGIASSLMHFKTSQSAVAETEDKGRAEGALRQYKLALLKEWPNIAESLIRGRFDSSVRDANRMDYPNHNLTERLTAIWSDSLENAINQASRRLSSFSLQLFFNLPTIFILAHAGYQTSKTYFTGVILSSDFFLHTFLTIVFILFLSFFLFQLLVKLVADTRRISSSAFELMKKESESYTERAVHPAAGQIDNVIELSLAVMAPGMTKKS